MMLRPVPRHTTPRYQLLTCTVLLALALSLSPAAAEEIPWIEPAGGLFHDPANWEGGAVPGFTDTPLFGIGNGQYVVSVQGNVNTRGIHVENNDDVALNLRNYSWTLGGTLRVAAGKLQVLGGNLVPTGSPGQAVEIGTIPAAQATLRLSDASLDPVDDLTIGAGGSGFLHLDGAAFVDTVRLTATAPDEPGGYAAVLLSGPDTSMSVFSETELRGLGAGVTTLQLADGSAFTTDLLFIDGQFQNRDGEPVLSLSGGSSLACGETLNIGADFAQMKISDASTVTANRLFMSFNGDDDTAQQLVLGGDGSLELGSALTSGSVTIRDGIAVNCGASWDARALANVPIALRVLGPGTRWTLGLLQTRYDALYDQPRTNIEVAGGAVVTIGSWGTGSEAPETPITVRDPGTRLTVNGAPANFGLYLNGTVDVSNGALLELHMHDPSPNPPGPGDFSSNRTYFNGDVLLHGPGTRIDITGDFARLIQPGAAQHPRIEIRNGATLRIGGKLNIDRPAGPSMPRVELVVREPGSLLEIGSTLNTDRASQAAIVVADGGRITAPGFQGDHEEYPGLWLYLNSTLAGDGEIVGDVTAWSYWGFAPDDAAVLRPGDPYGTLTIDGDLEWVAHRSRIEFEIAGPAPEQHDRLVVTGTASFEPTYLPDRPAIEIELIDGYMPADGASFTLLSAGAVEGRPADLVQPMYADGAAFLVEFAPDTIKAHRTQVTDITVSPAEVLIAVGEPFELEITGTLPSGVALPIEHATVLSVDDPAVLEILDSNRVRGLASGSTTLRVRYRDTEVSVAVEVADPGELPLELVTISSTGEQQISEDVYLYPRISRDGRFVFFQSSASNLVDEPVPTGSTQLYVRDRLTQQTTLLSRNASGALPDGIIEIEAVSANGRFVLYRPSFIASAFPDAPEPWSLVLHDRDSDEDGVYDEPDGYAQRFVGMGPNSYCALSPDGTYLVQGVNGYPGETAKLWLIDCADGAAMRISELPSDTYSSIIDLAISDDLRSIAIASREALDPADTNGATDIYVFDRDADNDGVFDEGPPAIFWASQRPDGTATANGAYDVRLTPDGRFLTFLAPDDLLPDDPRPGRDVVLIDRDTDGDGIFDEPDGVSRENLTAPFAADLGETRVLTHGISKDAHSLVLRVGDLDEDSLRDVYHIDLSTNAIQRLTTAPAGAPASSPGYYLDITGDGERVVFESAADNLVPNDSNDSIDAFLWTDPNTTRRRARTLLDRVYDAVRTLETRVESAPAGATSLGEQKRAGRR